MSHTARPNRHDVPSVTPPPLGLGSTLGVVARGDTGISLVVPAGCDVHYETDGEMCISLPPGATVQLDGPDIGIIGLGTV